MRELASWNKDDPELYKSAYRRSSEEYMKRANIIVDDREAGIFGIGSSFEEADAALKSFLNPECVCFPGDNNICKVHPDVQVREYNGLPSLFCKFTEFDPDYERWPSSSFITKDGNIDHDFLEKWGWKWEQDAA